MFKKIFFWIKLSIKNLFCKEKKWKNIQTYIYLHHILIPTQENLEEVKNHNLSLILRLEIPKLFPIHGSTTHELVHGTLDLICIVQQSNIPKKKQETLCKWMRSPIQKKCINIWLKYLITKGFKFHKAIMRFLIAK